jgi:hypothetical protein
MPSLQDRLCTAAREQTAREDRARLLAGVLNALPLALAFWIFFIAVVRRLWGVMEWRG